MTTIVITGHTNQNTGTDDVYQLTVDGVAYTYEMWSTENSSGAEWYQDGKSVPGPFIWPADEDAPESIDDDERALQDLIDRFSAAYYPLWTTLVVPVIDTITAKTIALTNAGIICAGCGKLLERTQQTNPWVNSSGDAYCTQEDGNVDRHVPKT